MDLRSAPLVESIGELPPAPRQRWRMVLARSAEAPSVAGRELIDAWERTIEATGLPLHRAAGRPRPRVMLGASLPTGMAAEGELAEIVLTEVLPAWRVRDALVGRLPPGWRLLDLHDVWLGSPALAGQVSGAVYRVEVDGTADRAAVGAAAAALLRAEHLPRHRLKGGSPIAYDLRPLLQGIEVLDPGLPVTLRVWTRMHPEHGTGRPEEVLAALADRLGCPLAAASIVRERLILADEPD